jgi:hypothetical protein
MPQKNLYGISANFCRVLAKVKNTIISRKELILLAMTNNLTEKQASGLIDRNIHFLKKQGFATANGFNKYRNYVFTNELLENVRLSSNEYNKIYNLTSEQRSLEEELLLTRYELQAYRELLEQLPQEKHKITKLHKTASEKLYQINGKLRAVNQLISF